MGESKFTVTLDDDPLVSRIIEAVLGMKTLAFSSSEAFHAKHGLAEPIAVFVDIHLGPNESGLDVIPQIKARWPYCPIIVVTANLGGQGVSQALIAGAHDFLKKPIDQEELKARLHARTVELAERANSELVQLADLTLNLSRNELKGSKQTSYLSYSDMRLLAYLALSKGSLVPRAELKRKIWGDLKVTDNALDKKLYEIRRALKEVSEQVELKAVYGKGVRLIHKQEAGVQLLVG